MRLESRIEKLEASVPDHPLPKHVIIAGDGQESEALDAYGRERIADGDDIFWIILTSPARGRRL